MQAHLADERISQHNQEVIFRSVIQTLGEIVKHFRVKTKSIYSITHVRSVNLPIYFFPFKPQIRSVHTSAFI